MLGKQWQLQERGRNSVQGQGRVRELSLSQSGELTCTAVLTIQIFVFCMKIYGPSLLAWPQPHFLADEQDECWKFKIPN